MNQLEGREIPEQRLVIGTASFGRGDRQNRTDTLAAAEHGISHRFVNRRRLRLRSWKILFQNPVDDPATLSEVFRRCHSSRSSLGAGSSSISNGSVTG